MKVGRIVGDSSLYVLGNVLRRGVSIITMPVFTRYLSPTGYGVLALVGTVQNLLEPVYSMGMQQAATRLYYEAPDAPTRQRLFGTLLFVLVSRAVPITALLLVLGPWLWHWTVTDVPFVPYVALTMGTVILGTMGLLPRVLFRVEDRVPTFFRLSVTQTLLAAGLSVVLVVPGGWGPLGPVLGTFLAEAVFCVIYTRRLWPHIALVLDRPTARRALRFGVPIAAVNIGLWAMKASDRLLLQHFTSLAVVGLYSVACSVSKIAFDVIANAVTWAVVPFVYSTFTREPEHRAKAILARLATYNVAVLVTLGLATVLYARELILILASARYADAATVVPLVAAASMMQVIWYIPARGINFREKTFYFPIVVGASAALSLALNVALIPSLGMQGAAIAMLASQTACVGLTFPISQRLYPIPYEWGRLARLLIVATVIATAAAFVPDGSSIPSLALKAMLLLVFPGLVLLTGFFSDDEIRAADLRLAATLRGLTSRGGRVGALATAARRLLTPAADALLLLQVIVGASGRMSAAPPLQQRLSGMLLIVRMARDTGVRSVWRRHRVIARPRPARWDRAAGDRPVPQRAAGDRTWNVP